MKSTISATPIPPRLEEIVDSPKQLWIRGTAPDWGSGIFVTIVGSRRYSEYGKLVVEALIRDLAGTPVTIVSGLALGMDELAHRAALKHGLRTLAFPGSGLDDAVIAPATNYRLAMDIVEAGGALFSEFDPAQRATPWTFPKRNRLMAGLSHAVVVIEATQKSGTLITARLATEYNRDLFTVPGSIFRAQAAGPNQLLKAGAYPLTSAQDLLAHYDIQSPQASAPADTGHDLNDLERAIVRALDEPRSKTELANLLEKDFTAMAIALSGLEIKGYVAETYGKIHRVR
jgi:DNA processing protein